ncbi:MAG: hypothetical protein ABIG60_03370 [Patescibacteria group bacterium]
MKTIEYCQSTLELEDEEVRLFSSRIGIKLLAILKTFISIKKEGSWIIIFSFIKRKKIILGDKIIRQIKEPNWYNNKTKRIKEKEKDIILKILANKAELARGLLQNSNCSQYEDCLNIVNRQIVSNKKFYNGKFWWGFYCLDCPYYSADEDAIIIYRNCSLLFENTQDINVF